MSEMLQNIIGSFVLFFSIINVWGKLLNKKINYKNYKFYLVWIFLSLFSIFNHFFTNKFAKIFILILVMITLCKFLFRSTTKKTIIVCLYEQLIIMLSEMIVILLIVSIFQLNVEALKEQYLGTLIVNIGEALFAFAIVNIGVVKKLYNILISYLDRISERKMIIFSLILAGIFNILAMVTYFEIDFRLLISLNVSFILFCFLIVMYSFKVQNKFNKVSDKYNVAINSLKDYENMITKYRIANHENKNLLLTIRAMILSKEKNIPEYIDSMVENNYNDDEKLLFNISVIPSGGLRATIYSEILKIKENKIDYNLIIDKKIRTLDLIDLSPETILQICKIIGVFVDNSIEATKPLKNGNILIEIFKEKSKIFIKIANSYEGIIDTEKIYNPGYTTKDGSHGYGLSLVKELIENNKIFSNSLEISDSIFTQILSIDLSKK